MDGAGPLRVTARKEGWLAAIFEQGKPPTYDNGVLGRQVRAVVITHGVPTVAADAAADRWLAQVAVIARVLSKAGFLVLPATTERTGPTDVVPLRP